MEVSPSEELMLSNKSLLLVDDNVDVCADLYQLLKPRFKSVHIAHSAGMAWDILTDNPVDVLITDIEMPGMDGLDFVQRIRAGNHPMAVVILSAYSDKDYLMRAANSQIDAYIIKPLSSAKLNQALKNICRRLAPVTEKVEIREGVYYTPSGKSLEVDGGEVSLGAKEAQLLELLLGKSPALVTRDDIERAIWPNGDGTIYALKNLIGELRRKVGGDAIQNKPARGWFIELKNKGDDRR